MYILTTLCTGIYRYIIIMGESEREQELWDPNTLFQTFLSFITVIVHL